MSLSVVQARWMTEQPLGTRFCTHGEDLLAAHPEHPPSVCHSNGDIEVLVSLFGKPGMSYQPCYFWLGAEAERYA